jgi:4'-phosphopantetheinyl transferase
MTANPPAPLGLPESAGADRDAPEFLLVRLTLAATEAECQQLTTLLSADEQERVARRLPDVRRRAVVSRGRLRQLLGCLLSMQPQAVPLGTNSHGKPVLTGSHTGSLAFNVSHSGDEGLIAVTRQGPVGIDLEIGKPVQDAAWARLMAGTIFSPEELCRWQALPEHLTVAAILDAWVAKEAVFKAAGTGIGDRLRQCLLPHDLSRVALATPDRHCRCGLVSVGLPSAAASGHEQFGLTLLDLGVGCHAALACRASSAVVTMRSFQDVLQEGLA